MHEAVAGRLAGLQPDRKLIFRIDFEFIYQEKLARELRFQAVFSGFVASC